MIKQTLSIMSNHGSPPIIDEMRMIENNHGAYIRNEIASVFPNKKIYFMTDYCDPAKGFNRNPTYMIEPQIAFTPVFHEIKWMKEDHLKEVKDKKAFLAYEMFLESGDSYIKWMYIKCIRAGIPTEQLIVIGSSIDFQKHSEKYAEMFNVKPMINVYYSFFERNTKRRFLLDCITHDIDLNTDLNTLENIVPEDKIKNTDPLSISQFKKRFIFLNHVPRLHRLAMLSLLNSDDLLKYGYVSFFRNPNISNLDLELKFLFKDPKQYKKVMQGLNVKIPLYLDDVMKYVDNIKGSGDRKGWSGNPANQSLLSLHEFVNHSFVSLIAETHFHKDRHNSYEERNLESRFLTEKTFKSMIFKQPFILMALPKTLEVIRSLGYKTFSPIIDESYDHIEDDGERLYKIFLEVKRLCQLDDSAIEENRKRLIPIIEHNYNLLMTRKDFFHHIRPTSKSAI